MKSFLNDASRHFRVKFAADDFHPTAFSCGIFSSACLPVERLGISVKKVDGRYAETNRRHSLIEDYSP
jgi:hypothetical protein